jgi:type IV pilus assembly protein PilN
MYSLDINFLNDRVERPTETGRPDPRIVQDSPRPIFLGVGVAALLLGSVVGLWVFLQSRNAALAQRQAELDSELAALQAQLSEVDTINQQITAINTEVQALGSVFNQIKPWSALLQDIRDRVPANVRIGSIEQLSDEESATAAAAGQPSPAPQPSPAASPTDPNAAPADPNAAPVAPAPPATSVVQISGLARSFDDVNDFVLTLKRSPFLEAEETRLLTAELIDNPTQIEFGEGIQSNNIEVELPQVVQYTISSQLTDLPASELFQDLERTLAVGLTARIQALRERGVIQP